MKQKGQDIIEFALLLPLFMMLLYGMMYASFFYGDYMTISGIVRNAAREAAVVSEYNEDEKDITGSPINNYDKIRDTYVRVLNNTQMTTHLYAFQGMTITSTGTNPADGEPANSVKVVAHMKLTDNVLLIRAMQNRGMNFILDGYDIEYYMYDETTGTTKT